MKLLPPASGLVLAVLACSSSTGDASLSQPLPPLVGADISSLARIEQAGGAFRDSGQVRDAIAILRAHGSTIFRLRLFVHPSGSEIEVNDLPYTVALAQRVKASGAKLLLDIHYSDTWADPGHQARPAAWASLPFDSLALQVARYTDSAVATLRQAGATPDIVQVGNEIDGGLLWPAGRVGGSFDTPAQWSQLATLLEAGIQGARTGAAPAGVQILLHFANGADTGGTRWFYDHLVAAGVSWDITGVSYYPWWHGPIASLRANLAQVAARYGTPVMVVEAAYPWRTGGWETWAGSAPMPWPVSPGGQSEFLRDVAGAVLAVPDSLGLGVLWWYPESIQVNGLFAWGGGSLAWFDPAGNVLPAATWSW